MSKLGIIHTVTKLAPLFADLIDELLPGVEVATIADDLLLKRTIRDGAVDVLTRDRLLSHVDQLVDFGVDAVLVTCSSLGGIVDEIASRTAIPVLRVDRGMAERAIELGSTIGVLATLPTTLGPTKDLVEAAARDAGQTITVDSRLCAGAFAALDHGDAARHDSIIAEELDRLAAVVDVVVLAQASMARIAAQRPEGGTPVLSSPRLAMEWLVESDLFAGSTAS